MHMSNSSIFSFTETINWYNLWSCCGYTYYWFSWNPQSPMHSHVSQSVCVFSCGYRCWTGAVEPLTMMQRAKHSHKPFEWGVVFILYRLFSIHTIAYPLPIQTNIEWCCVKLCFLLIHKLSSRIHTFLCRNCVGMQMLWNFMYHSHMQWDYPQFATISAPYFASHPPYDTFIHHTGLRSIDFFPMTLDGMSMSMST